MADQFIRGSGVRGIAFPIKKGVEGYWTRRNAAAIRQTSIIMILGTNKGERVMLPEFGSRLPVLLFEPNDESTLQDVMEETRDALQRWDPFIKVLGVSPEVDGDAIKLFIDYVDLRSDTQEQRRLVMNLRRS